MSVEANILTYLLTISAITDIVVARIYIHDLPQEATFPAITYHRISNVKTISQDGDSNLDNDRFQFSCWSYTFVEITTLVDALETALHCYKGAMGDMTAGSSFLENKPSIFEPDTKLFHVPVDFKITHNG